MQKPFLSIADICQHSKYCLFCKMTNQLNIQQQIPEQQLQSFWYNENKAKKYLKKSNKVNQFVEIEMSQSQSQSQQQMQMQMIQKEKIPFQQLNQNQHQHQQQKQHLIFSISTSYFKQEKQQKIQQKQIKVKNDLKIKSSQNSSLFQFLRENNNQQLKLKIRQKMKMQILQIQKQMQKKEKEREKDYWIINNMNNLNNLDNLDNLDNLNSDNKQKNQKKKKRKKKSKLQNTQLKLQLTQTEFQKMKNIQQQYQQQSQAAIQAELYANQYLNSLGLKNKNRANNNIKEGVSYFNQTFNTFKSQKHKQKSNEGKGSGNGRDRDNLQKYFLNQPNYLLPSFKLSKSTESQKQKQIFNINNSLLKNDQENNVFTSSSQASNFFSSFINQKNLKQQKLANLISKLEQVAFQMIDFVSYEMVQTSQNTFNFYDFKIKYQQEQTINEFDNLNDISSFIEKKSQSQKTQKIQQELKRRSLSPASVTIKQFLNILQYFQDVYENISQEIQDQLDNIGMNELQKVLFEKIFRQQFAKKLLLYLPEIKDFFVLYQEKIKQSKRNTKRIKKKKSKSKQKQEQKQIQKISERDNKVQNISAQSKKFTQPIITSNQLKTEKIDSTNNLSINYFQKIQQNQIDTFFDLLKIGSITPMIRYLTLLQQEPLKTSQFLTLLMKIAPKQKNQYKEQKQKSIKKQKQKQEKKQPLLFHQTFALRKSQILKSIEKQKQFQFSLQSKKSKRKQQIQLQRQQKLNKQFQKQREKTNEFRKKINNLSKSLKERYPNQSFDFVNELQAESSLNLDRFLKNRIENMEKNFQLQQKKQKIQIQPFNQTYQNQRLRQRQRQRQSQSYNGKSQSQSQTFLSLYKFLENFKIPPQNKLIQCRFQDGWKQSISKKILKKQKNNQNIELIISKAQKTDKQAKTEKQANSQFYNSVDQNNIIKFSQKNQKYHIAQNQQFDEKIYKKVKKSSKKQNKNL